MSVKQAAAKMFGKPASAKPQKFVQAAIPNPGSPKALFKPKKAK